MDVFKTLLISTPGTTGSSVAITGGSINGTNIGATTPGTGAFTTLTASGATTLTAATASTSTTTGALVVSGGVGVAGAGYFGGNVVVSGGTTTLGPGSGGASAYALLTGGTQESWYQVTNSAVTSGQRSWRLGTATVAGTMAANSFGLQRMADAFGSATDTVFDAAPGTFRFGSPYAVTVQSTTASSSTTTGALIVSGGVGVAGAANVGTYYGMVDGVTAPGATVGYAKIYVDTADGDLKVIFGDGTIKTLATDT